MSEVPIMPEFKKMTKTEFTREANKAGVPPELYGAVLAGRFIGPDGEVAGGKVSGIVWLEDWTSEERYSHMRGTYTEKYLAPQAYVVLKKDRMSYRIEAYRIGLYVLKKMHAWLAEYVKDGRAV